MRDFIYHRAKDLADAEAKLAAAEDPKLIAGGMTLLPTLKQRLAAPSDLIDLADVPGMKGITLADDGLVIGAMTCHADVAASEVVAKAIPALSTLAGGIGDPAVRHRGTIGGSVANADPAADYPSAVVGLDAIVVTNQREIAGDDFFLDLFETALEPGEIITAVRFKIPDCAAYLKFRHPASGYAVVGVMIARFGDKVRVAVTGAGPNAFRVAAMETALQAEFSSHVIAGIKVDPTTLLGDIHCSAEYRSHLITVLARRAVDSIAA
ncbi:MAG TPA: xanthine dehydrogenase family protein subunit M [Beijerinckiaceae bacterium]|nr:xanthine dehydrogenase family protein subunit M [Beijerinckiaceae bacterium]